MKVLDVALEYLMGADDGGVAVAIKHFPGDGVDERDQHILTSVNSFSTEKWDETYGYVYGILIKKGAKTVMVGHIAQPANVKALQGRDAASGFFIQGASYWASQRKAGI